MAPISPGKMSGPPRKPKKQTATTKAHRFEGFAKRIAKIKIDPIHTVQKSRISEDHNDLSNSFFRSALDEWSELNLSATFTSFFNKVQPLSESLPQLLHHADKIFTLLHEHIEKKDTLALEPLLSLVAHLAHDLGPAFEKYFPSTVRLVARVSASVDNPESIEQCFTCLAWMFKYLSKRLVQDLRPLLEIMVPHLSSKKEYLRRFGAESLAFLLRKAAVMYIKNATPLKLAVSYLFDRLEEETGVNLDLFENALMTLLSESAISVDAQLHSSAADLLRCVLDQVAKIEGHEPRAIAVLDGTIINLVHRTDATGFKPLLQLITADTSDSETNSPARNDTFINLLLDVTTTRKGSRITEWKAVIETLLGRMYILQQGQGKEQDLTYRLLTISAAVVQYCPMDQLLPFTSSIIDRITSDCTSRQFFAFCEMTAELGTVRFQDLVLPRLQQYIVSHWRDAEDGVCYLVQRLRDSHVISPKPNERGYLTCPVEWEHRIVRSLADESYSSGHPEEHSKYFRLHRHLHFPRSNDDCERLRSIIKSRLDLNFRQKSAKFDLPVRLDVGWAFQLYLLLSKNSPKDSWVDLLDRIFECRPEYYELVPFLECCLDVLRQSEPSVSQIPNHELMVSALCKNMLSESLDLRENSIEILLVIGRMKDDQWLTETCTLLLELIKIPYLPSTARQIAMLLRRLPRQQELGDKQSVTWKLIPLAVMGLLRHYHDQTRKDLCIALSVMVSKSGIEDIVLEVAIQWLQKPRFMNHTMGPSTQNEKLDRLSPFQCSNHQAIQKLSEDIFDRHSHAQQHLQSEFEKAHSLKSVTTPDDSRVLALQVLSEIPEVAERRSRALSPVFLSVQQGMVNNHVTHSDESTSSYTISPDYSEQPWSLRERKLFLELMGKFVNPKVLYRSRELYDHLLELLTSGNADVRRIAFSALMNWKDPSLPQYQDVLLRVAEEKNAINELASLLANEEESGSVKTHDRANVLPVLLRLVFGQLVGRAGTQGTQEAKRKSILRLLFRMDEYEVNQFLGIALGRLSEVSFLQQAIIPGQILNRDIISQDQQYGFLRMMQSIQDILQSQFAPYGKKVVDAILYCTARACHRTKDIGADDQSTHTPSALARNIRRNGIQCLTTVFECCEDIDWSPYLPTVFNEIVDPRVPNLTLETTQGISGLLRLFQVWSQSSRLTPLLKRNDQLLKNLWGILSVSSARDDVKIYILESILAPLLDVFVEERTRTGSIDETTDFNVEVLLQSLVSLLESQPSKDLLLVVTRTIPLLAPFAVSSKFANEVLDLLITLLCEPGQRIPPHIRSQLLSATESLLSIQQDEIASTQQVKLYDVVSGLYNYFKDTKNRTTLGDLLSTLAKNDDELQETIQFCQDLNASSVRHLGEIDYDRQLGAYTKINSLPILSYSSQQWLPIINNLLFFSRTADDFAIRSNAVSCLKRFVAEACQGESSELQDLTRSLLLPAFRKGARENSELVRADFVAMYGLLVRHLSELQDMKVLLVGDDEEASFFTNILHIQQHRRLRAIRRLITEVERGAIKSTNIANFFLPLLEKFIDDADVDESAQGVKGQSIAATSTLLQWLDWKSFRTTFRQYKTDLDTAARPEKEAIKLLNNAADALTLVSSIGPDHDIESETVPHLKHTLPSMETVSTELKLNFIPKLSKFIHLKDEAEISLRIPAAKVAVKLIKLLPANEIPLLVSPVILDVSQILRSRLQESRDIARNTLAEIVVLLGSSSVQFILREMRTTLTRGYQLHVLSYALHSILLQSAEQRSLGDLDYCLDELVSVIMDDIFGVVGQEKENQEYISSMKEVKSSKSADSLEILAKSASVRSLSKLVQPFQTLLNGNLTTKQIRQVDELFRRIGVGIAHNPVSDTRDLLVFSYELIQAFYRQKAEIKQPVLTNAERNRQRYLIQLKSASETTKSASTSMQYKIARFALDIVRSTLAKHVSLLTSENVHGFLPIIGDALVEAQEDVKTSAFRLLSTIMKLPLSELDTNATLYVMEAVKVVRGSISTNEESSQAALKLVAAILRERKDVEVRDSDVAYLLQRTMPDIEEPDRQGVTFNFIKAVMARQYQLPEVYELVDKIAVMMVTNQTRSARDVARGVYVHFLLDYPQSKGRWTKQLKFLVKNLEYEFREGRQSVMEAIHALLQKLDDDLLEDVVSTFFVPVVLRMANDDFAGCREMAGALLAQLFRTASGSQLTDLLGPLRSWLDQTDNIPLLKIGMQAWTVYFDAALDGAEAEVPAVRKSIARVIQGSNSDTDDWETQYTAVELFSKLASRHPAMTMSQKQANIWTAIRQFLLSPHSWVQVLAANLIGEFFQQCMNDENLSQMPLTNSYGLSLDQSAISNLLRDSLRVLKRNEGNTGLAQQTLQNLSFLAKLAEASKLTTEVKAVRVKDGGDDGPNHAPNHDLDSDASSDSNSEMTRSIPAIQYLLDQLVSILRREPSKLTTSSFMPRVSALGLLKDLLPQLSSKSLPASTLTSLLVPLTHITDPSLLPPRSSDMSFAETYQSYTESAHELQEIVQRRVGDSEYVKLMTAVSKIVRERRGERRTKRAIERVADPERAQREKKRKREMKARRNKNVVDIHRKRRRADLGF